MRARTVTRNALESGATRLGGDPSRSSPCGCSTPAQALALTSVLAGPVRRHSVPVHPLSVSWSHALVPDLAGKVIPSHRVNPIQCPREADDRGACLGSAPVLPLCRSFRCERLEASYQGRLVSRSEVVRTVARLYGSPEVCQQEV